MTELFPNAIFDSEDLTLKQKGSEPWRYEWCHLWCSILGSKRLSIPVCKCLLKKHSIEPSWNDLKYRDEQWDLLCKVKKSICWWSIRILWLIALPTFPETEFEVIWEEDESEENPTGLTVLVWLPIWASFFEEFWADSQESSKNLQRTLDFVVVEEEFEWGEDSSNWHIWWRWCNFWDASEWEQ